MSLKRKYEQAMELYPEGTFLWADLRNRPKWPCVVIKYMDGGFVFPKEKYRWVFLFCDDTVLAVDVSHLYTFVEHFNTFYFEKKRNTSDWKGESVLWTTAVVTAVGAYGHPFTKTWREDDLVCWAVKGFEFDHPYSRREPEVPKFVKEKLSQYNVYNVFNVENDVNICSKSKANKEQKEMINECLEDLAVYHDYNFCFGCYKLESTEDHPILLGKYCKRCLSNFKQIMHASERGGPKGYCVVCATSGYGVVCGSKECRRTYCVTCLGDLAAPGAKNKIMKRKQWRCFICSDNDKDMQGLLQPRKEWKHIMHNIFAHNDDVLIKPPELHKKKQKLTILSLFDGIGKGLFALKQLNIGIQAYYISETDINAIEIVKTHFPGDNVITLGDIRFINGAVLKGLSSVDLVLIGSFNNNLRAGQKDPSSLFYEFYRVLTVLKSANNKKFFWLFENVATASIVLKTTMSRFLQCNPVNIKSAELPSKISNRLYWGNLPSLKNYTVMQEFPSPSPAGSSKTANNCAPKMQDLALDSDTPFSINDYEKIFGFPENYTQVGDINEKKRLDFIKNAWSVRTLMQLLQCLQSYYVLTGNSDQH